MISKEESKRGGKRSGAGRPKNSGKFKEETVAIRVPKSQLESILSMRHKRNKFPLFESAVAAGMPSFADSEMQEEIDLNEFVMKNPLASFFVRVSGDSMVNVGIHHNDVLVVDRSVEVKDGKL